MRTLGFILVALLVIAAAAWFFQRRLIYLPARGNVPAAAELVAGAGDVVLETEDGLELGAWFVPARSDSPGLTVLVANGNAGDRSLRAPLADALADAGLSVLLFDYRGYADNPGTPSEDGLARDVRAARRYLIEERGVAQDSLIYFGESLGTGVVTELATEHPPAGLVLRSPFVDLYSMAREHYRFVPALLLRERYPVLEHVRSIEVPTVVVYGSSDSIVPPEQSRDVADAAAGDTRVVEVEGADHNDAALLDGPELIEAVVDLAERVSGRSGSETSHLPGEQLRGQSL